MWKSVEESAPNLVSIAEILYEPNESLAVFYLSDGSRWIGKESIGFFIQPKNMEEGVHVCWKERYCDPLDRISNYIFDEDTRQWLRTAPPILLAHLS